MLFELSANNTSICYFFLGILMPSLAIFTLASISLTLLSSPKDSQFFPASPHALSMRDMDKAYAKIAWLRERSRGGG